MDDRRPLDTRRPDGRVEREIRELERAGELRGLPGEGRPFAPDPDADAGDAWAARHLMRTARARPAWAELRREVTEQRARIVQRLRAHLAWVDRRQAMLRSLPAERIVMEVQVTREADARVRRELAGAVEQTNALARDHNLIVSAAALHLPIATLDGLIEIAGTHRR